MFGYQQHGRRCGPGRGGFGRGNPFAAFAAFALDEGARGGRPRRFGGDELRLVLLRLIEERPSHGYELIRAIEERSGGAYAPSPGVVYPSLTLLADMELIAEQASEGTKKSFAITPSGQAHLTEHEEEVAALMERLAALGTMQGRARRGPVKRAMLNLRTALSDRLGGHEVEQETLHAIAEIIDEAARRIERL